MFGPTMHAEYLGEFWEYWDCVPTSKMLMHFTGGCANSPLYVPITWPQFFLCAFLGMITWGFMGHWRQTLQPLGVILLLLILANCGSDLEVC